MQTIELKKGLNVELETIIMGLSRLEVADLTDFFARLNQQVRQIAPPLDTVQQEILLLKQIKAKIPRSVVSRLKVLQVKRQKGLLSAKELSEMLLITDFIENKSAERVYLLGKLAQLRKVSITELAQQLDLKNFHG